MRSDGDPMSVVRWWQTALNGGAPTLLQEQPPLPRGAGAAPPPGSLVIDWTETFQTIDPGFGGAFTEAAALNWRALSRADRARVIDL